MSSHTKKTDPCFEKEVYIRQAVCLTRTGCLSIKKKTTVTMSVEELMRTKETIEDLIAEKEMQEQSITVEAGQPGIAEA